MRISDWSSDVFSSDLPYLPNLPTPEGPVLEKIRAAMREAGLI